VFTTCSPFVWRVLLRLGVQSRDVPDACQDAFLVVHRRLPEFEPARSALRSWVYGICLRVASDYRRRSPSRREAAAEALQDVSVSAPQEDALRTAQAWQKLAQVLDSMDAGKRDAFVLYELEALPMAEVAQILECPLQTAYARLHAARRLVLAAFARSDPDE
jgi:RNA polymerase sigma-70 factor, ECF subfamily